MAGVRYAKVSKSFGAVQAVREVELEVVDGEFLVLLGPSGWCRWRPCSGRRS